MRLLTKRITTLLLCILLGFASFSALLSLYQPRQVLAEEDEPAKEVRTKEQLDWKDITFGSSATNKTIPDSNYAIGSAKTDEVVTLASINGAGKFTTGGYDGITFQYVEIDPTKEDFYLSATIKVVEMGVYNPSTDSYTQSGQEGFALLVRDTIGVHGLDATSTVNDVPVEGRTHAYSNSVAAIATKITTKSPTGANLDLKNGVGARYVSGITDRDATPEAGTFSTTYERFADSLVEQKMVYNFSVEKVNTKYVLTADFGKAGTVTRTFWPDRETGADRISAVDPYLYVGLAVARNCIAEFSNIVFNVYDKSDEEIVIPDEIVTSLGELNDLTAVNTDQYDFRFFANQKGSLTIKINDVDVAGKVGIPLEADQRYSTTITLPSSYNKVEASFSPDPSWTPGVGMVMSNYGATSYIRNVTVDKYGTPSQNIIVAPYGTDDGHGTHDRPLSLQRALSFCQPGQVIIVKEGNYFVNSGLTIQRGNNGTANAVKRMIADPEATSRPVVNFNGNLGFVIKGDYWHIKGIDFTNTKDKEKAVTIWGNNNTLELVKAYRNGNTGIQISGSTQEPSDMWPKNNLVLNSDSYHNKDSDYADADGFAAKLTCGDGNKFVGCIAYENADDGFDLYAKPENGLIGIVVIENSVAYRNGHIPGEEGKGNGNGFKLGGSNMSGKHILRNSIAFENDEKGIDSNSCPDNEIYLSTSFNNGAHNVALYSGASTTSFIIDGVLSFRTEFKGIKENLSTTNSAAVRPIRGLTNFFWDEKNEICVNSAGTQISASNFYSLESPEVVERDENGYIDMGDFLRPRAAVPKETGARLTDTPGEELTIGSETVPPRAGGSGDDDDTSKGFSCGAVTPKDIFGGFAGGMLLLSGAFIFRTLKRKKSSNAAA